MSDSPQNKPNNLAQPDSVVNNGAQQPCAPYPPYPPYGYAPQADEDEIDLAELWAALMKRKKLIAQITVVITLFAVLYSLTLKNQFKSEALLAPTTAQSGGSKLASQFGGLASLAGVSLPGSGGDATEEALAILKSRKFIVQYLKQNQIKPILFYENWDAEQQNWIVASPSILSQIKTAIMGEQPTVTYPGQEILPPGEPSHAEAFDVFSKLLSTSKDKDSGLVTLSVEWENPVLVQQWANDLVKALNAQLRQEAISKSQTSIEYLQKQLEQTANVELRKILFSMIEDNTKNITLAKTTEEYAFKVIDPAVVPEKKSKPKRGLIVAVALVLGLMLGVFVALIQNWRETKVDESMPDTSNVTGQN